MNQKTDRSGVAEQLLQLLDSQPNANLDEILTMFQQQPVQTAQAPIGPQEGYIGAQPRPDTVQTVLPPSGVAQTPGRVGKTVIPGALPATRRPMRIITDRTTPASPSTQIGPTEGIVTTVPAGADRGRGQILPPIGQKPNEASSRGITKGMGANIGGRR